MSGYRRLIEHMALGACAFILSRAVLSLFLAPGETPTDGNLVWKLILSISYMSIFVALLPFYREVLYICGRNWHVVALVALALCSFLWAATPSLVFRRGIAVLGTTLLGVALALLLSLHDQIRLLVWLFRAMAILSLACVVFAPSYGIADSGEWRGVFDHKNGLGSMMALSILVEWHFPAYTGFAKFAKWQGLLLSGLLLLFSRSLTPTLALIGSLVCIEIFKFANQHLRVPFYVTGLVAFLAALSAAVIWFSNNERIMLAMGRSADLTGRTEIWSWVVSFILERPILGYGYSGFWLGASPESISIDRTMGTAIMYSHNGYLEILLNLGVVGFFLALVFVATGIRRALYRSNLGQSRVDLWPLALLLYFLFHNFGECTILYQDLEWAVCVAAVIGADAALLSFEEEQQDASFSLMLAEQPK